MQNLIYIIQYYLYNSKNQIETQRLNEKWFTKNKMLEEWNEYYEYFINREKLYKFIIENKIQNIQETPSTHSKNTCVYCNNETRFIGLKHGYKKYCSRRCATKATLNLQKLKETMLDKYGVENAFQLESNRIKCNSKDAIDKKKITYAETCLKKYGVKTVLMLPEYRNDHLRNYKEIVEKFKATNMAKYGYVCTLNRPCVQEYIRKNKEASFQWIPLEDYEDFKLYRYWVWKFTNKQNLHRILNYNMRGRSDINENAHHLDHKYSMFQGFKDCILPFIIGSEYNLEMLHYTANISKGIKCSIRKEELFSSFYND